MTARFRALCAGMAALLVSAPLSAQSAADQPSPWRTLRIAKWSTVTLTGAAALYGFVSNRRADDVFDRIEEACTVTPNRCAARRPDGAYGDADLEAEYQRVRTLDRRARSALIGSQVGVGASIVLFILDLRNQRPPDNIPYEPRRLDIAPARDGGVRFEFNLPLSIR
jgi:hypothetical protein